MNNDEGYLPIFAMALATVLKDNEGIVVHYEGEGYAIYIDGQCDAIKLDHNDEYLNVAHGTLVWMHYEGSTAPEPKFDDEILIIDDNFGPTKH